MKILDVGVGDYPYFLLYRLSFRAVEEEQARLNRLNIEKAYEGNSCYCFLGEVLTSSSALEATRHS